MTNHVICNLINYIIGFFILFIPIFGLSTYLDCSFYGTLTFVPWNFIRVNIIEGLSATFGADPTWKYFTTELPARFNIYFPAAVIGLYYFTK